MKLSPSRGMKINWKGIFLLFPWSVRRFPQRNKIDKLFTLSFSRAVYICQFKVHYRFLFCFETRTKDGPVILSWTLFTG